MEEIRVGERYRHFREGTEYEIVAVARNREKSEEFYVVYKQLYETKEHPFGTVWFRKLEDFTGFKEVEGKKIKRFTLVE